MQGLYHMTTHAEKRAHLWALHREARRRGMLVEVLGAQLDAVMTRRMRKQWSVG